MTIIHLDPTTEIKNLARQCFPRYRGRRFTINNSGHSVNISSCWDGGSRSTFAMLELGTGKRLDIAQNGTMHDGGPIAPEGVKVPAGYVLAEHVISCGKDLGITFHIDPNTSTAFLPANVELTSDELIVLKATARHQNTYGGETDRRFREATRKHGISRDAWNTAKAALISRKLLNRAGAITNSGRNAIAR